MSRIHFTKQFNWRMMLVRILVNALALIFITILPDIHFVEPTVLRVLFVALILGVLNAFVKPIIQFLTLRFIFITFGLMVVIINAIILLLLSWLLPNMFVVDRFIWALVGGAFMGFIAGFLENLLGLQVPIFPEGAGPLPELTTDPSTVFERRIISGVIGEDVDLADEVSMADEIDESPAEPVETPAEPVETPAEPVETPAELVEAKDADSTQGGNG
jgi:putative membrane protein